MVTVLYRPVSEHARVVEDFQRELEKEGVEVRLLDVDTKEGQVFAQLHDVMQFPSVIATSSEGTPLQTWAGSLPLIKEVGYFAHQ